MNTTYSFPPYMNTDNDGNTTPIESPRDRLIREMSVAFIKSETVEEAARTTSPYVVVDTLMMIRDHANELYPPE